MCVCRGGGVRVWGEVVCACVEGGCVRVWGEVVCVCVEGVCACTVRAPTLPMHAVCAQR